ncbi:MAG: DedA family protein/thiosulfate sulfurtransferase GlpE [Pseudomonadota bacterium]|nr:DedA family protein/thiosulfate sulfurtransferase GlpE [Pseudomonadota bacterium]
MDTLIHLIAHYGLLFVFANVLVQQLGAPVPGYPMLMITGALAARGQLNPGALLVTAVAACLLADSVWYAIGRWSGRRVLRTLCKISLSPDGCVRQTESIFTRFGAASLLVAKFIPGFASVATALAGAMRIPRGAFVMFDACGSVLWVGVGLALGWLFAPAIEQIVAGLARFGEGSLVVVGLLIAGFVLAKWWQRYRFNRQLRMARVTVEGLSELLARGERPLIVDVRSTLAREDGRIPGATVALIDSLSPELLAHPKDRPIVVYCACPNDASAVLVARKLLELGYRDVRPLAGGIDAWTAAGRALEFSASDSASGRAAEPPSVVGATEPA